METNEKTVGLHEFGSGKLRLIHWPSDDGKMWLVEVNPIDGSYLPLAELKTDSLTASINLIVAAPELLNVIERCAAALDWYVNDVGECDVEALDAADAAIAKATN